MLKQTLHQIDHLSIQIQKNIKKALLINEPIKQPQTSPGTHYNSHPKNPLSHATNKGNEKSSSQPPILNQMNHLQSPSHIRPFMLESENQLLKAQLQEQKNKNKEYRQQIRQIKRYVKFLEEYNDNLKKEVVLWMTRPAKKTQFYEDHNSRKFQEYRQRFNQLVLGKSTKDNNYPSTNNNSMIINSSIDDKCHKAIKQQYCNSQKITFKNSLNPQLDSNEHSGSQRLSSRSLKRSHSSDSSEVKPIFQSKTTNLHENKKKCAKKGAAEKQCTSCNYLEYCKSKNRFFAHKKSSALQLNNRKNSANYQEFEGYHGSEKQKFSRSKFADSSKQANEFGHGYIQNRRKHGSMVLKQGKRSRKNDKNTLCLCHDRYIKQHRF